MLASALANLVASSPAHARGCTEHSDVVGLQHCSHFGEWSRDDPMPRLWFEVGYFHHTYESEPFTLAPAATVMSTLDSFETGSAGLALRVIAGLGHVFYAGGEINLGAPELHVAIDPTPSYGFYVAPNAVAGAHVDVLRVGFSAELALGTRHESFIYCPDKGCTYTENAQNRGVVEARIGVDVFLTRHWTIGAKLGKSLIDADDTTFMLMTSGHIRAMDGM